MIREYEQTDQEAVVTVWRTASTLAHPFLSEEFLDKEAENLRTLYLLHAQTWVYEFNGIIVGFIALIGSDIGGLFVDPAFHRRGAGTALIQKAVDLRGNLSVEVFEENQIGRQFYDRTGFLKSDRTIHGETGQAVLRLSLLQT